MARYYFEFEHFYEGDCDGGFDDCFETIVKMLNCTSDAAAINFAIEYAGNHWTCVNVIVENYDLHKVIMNIETNQ